jgi:hypothetical protein
MQKSLAEAAFWNSNSLYFSLLAGNWGGEASSCTDSVHRQINLPTASKETHNPRVKAGFFVFTSVDVRSRPLASGYASHVIEAQLAHAERNAVKAAYNRAAYRNGAS